MGYCTIADITRIIAQSLTSATSSTLGGSVSLLNIGSVLDKNLITDATVNSYILFSDSEINGILSELYKTPICEIADFETEIYASVSEYNDYIVLSRNCPIEILDNVILIDDNNNIEERHVISEIVGDNMYQTEEEIQYEFPSGSRLIRVKFPDPLPVISARLSAANIYDKYFSSQNSPNISDFGEKLRQLARADINNILNGRTILHGQQRIGRRFFNSSLVDQYDLPRGAEGSKDIDSLGK